MGVGRGYSPFCGSVAGETIVNAVVCDIWNGVVHINQVRVTEESGGFNKTAFVCEVSARDIDGGPGGGDHRIAGGDRNRSSACS